MKPTIETAISEVAAPPVDPALASKLERGRELSESIDLYKARQELIDIAAVIQAQSLPDRLSPFQLKRLVKQQADTLHIEQRKQSYRTADVDKIFQGISYRAVVSLLKKDRSIKSTLNVGCNYAYMDWLMAKEFTDVDFNAIDVNDDLVEFNSDLKLPNTHFYSGYALEKIESGELKADLIYTSSASTVIRNQELRKYADLIARCAKYYVVSEPLWTLPGGEITDPKTIDPYQSVASYVQREPMTGDFGYLCYNHNYRAIMEDAGFETIEYRFFKPEFGGLYWCVVIGQNKNDKLWM